MKPLDYVLSNEKEVLTFLRSRFAMFHLSNFFFRDFQFGIQMMLERKGMKVRYTDAENIAREFAGKLEKEKILTRIDQQSWVVNYPEFRKPAVKPPAAAPKPPAPVAKPAGTVQAAAKPATTPAAGTPSAATLPPQAGPGKDSPASAGNT